ncbi:MAG: hypothetical protein EPN79_16160 [Burkholderiaceae bacterium]|nr:MAG: hypothetical protein EPN79_16160 [Burkholderiaceae bacterium]
MNPDLRKQRLQLIRQIATADGVAPVRAVEAAPQGPLTHRRRWGLTPFVPLGGTSRHRALPNYMFTTLRGRS